MIALESVSAAPRLSIAFEPTLAVELQRRWLASQAGQRTAQRNPQNPLIKQCT